MSVKFEIADWRFEVTWKELIFQPVEQKTKAVKRDSAAGRKETEIIHTQQKENGYELDYATRRHVG